MKKKIIILFFLLICFLVYRVSSSNLFIPDIAIRLRVIPNSNDPYDIYIKEKVKAYLEHNIYSLTDNVTNIKEARNTISKNIPSIEENITKIFDDNNYQKEYHVDFGYNYFPEKTYKGITYDEGYYESLVISIGDANGDNWWCVLFPNYCLLDNNKVNNHKSLIKEIITNHSKKEK